MHVSKLSGAAMLRQLAVFLALPLLIALSGPAAAQILPGSMSAPEATEKVAIDPFGRETPRGLIKALLGAMTEAGQARAVDLMDLPASSQSFREARSKGYLQDLRRALDRSGRLDDTWEASSEATGRLGDGLPEDQEKIGSIITKDARIDILARRVPAPSGHGPAVWLLSHESLIAVSGAVSDLETSLVDRFGPRFLAKVEFAGVPGTHLGFALAAMLALLVLIKLAVRGFLSALLKVLGQERRSKVGGVLVALRPMLVTVLLGISIEPVLAFGGVSVVLRGMLAPLVHIATVAAMTLILVRLADRLSESAIRRAKRRGFTGSLSFLALARRGAKLTIVLAAVLAALSAVGVDLTAGLAALGIGGIAVALGSQKTIGDFVGSLSVVADRVVKIGDVCRFGTVIGTVEDIGIRSTRIRTLERTVLNIPNGVFSSTEIENFSERDMFRFHHHVALQAPASGASLRACLEDLRALVFGHEACSVEDSRVRLASMAQGLPHVEFMAYFRAENMPAFTAIQEEILLGVMDVIELHGMQMGVPTQLVRMESDGRASGKGGIFGRR